MDMIKAMAEINAKKMLRVAWIVQLGLLTVTTIVLVFGFPDRLTDWQGPLGILTGATVLEGGAAFGGTSLKRYTEGYKQRRGEPAP